MKRPSFIILFLFLAMAAYSQTDTTSNEKKIVNEMCSCIQPKVEKMHPQMVALIFNMVKYDEGEAGKILEKYLVTASETDSKRIVDDIDYMSKGLQVEIETCFKTIKTKYKDFLKGGEIDLSDADIKKHFGKHNSCSLVAALFKIGADALEEKK